MQLRRAHAAKRFPDCGRVFLAFFGLLRTGADDLLPPPLAAAPSIRFIVTHPSTSDSEWYGDCACICNKQKYGDINVEGDVSGKGISFQVCTEQGPEKCRELASTHQAFDNCTDAGGKAQNFTTDWDYNSNYTGAIWTPPPPPFTAPPPTTTMPPPTTTMPPPTTTMPPPSGNTTALGDCECMCNDASWIPQTWINKVDCPSGQNCPGSEDMCSNQGLIECQAMNTNNQYCSSDGVVSTAWTYVEAYDSMPPPMTTMPPPTTTMPPPSGNTTALGDCECMCNDASWIPKRGSTRWIVRLGRTAQPVKICARIKV